MAFDTPPLGGASFVCYKFLEQTEKSATPSGGNQIQSNTTVCLWSTQRSALDTSECMRWGDFGQADSVVRNVEDDIFVAK